MLFNSFSFFIFFPIVVIVYYLIPPKVRWICLLIASYIFYMNWNAKYAILLFFSTLTTWISGLIIEKKREDRKKKSILVMSLTINLLILAIFKYLIFFTNTANKILEIVNLHYHLKKYDIVLPVGISFYIFQALGYTVDVYRGTIKAEHNLCRYALFVSFFPQLVAGPIERSGNLLKQINEVPQKIQIEYERITSGCIYMLYGFFVKMVIADRIAIVVDKVWSNYCSYGSIELIITALVFSIQIYCDFMGYSCIAIGASQVLGFQIMDNFEAPYLASSIKEFWRRWHISLSSWFKDYLYIPLGGSRCSRIKQYRNIMIVFLLSGLWHGADWSYVIWGGLHGLFQVYEDLTKEKLKKFDRIIGIVDGSSFQKGIRIIKTFLLTSFAWIFFRASSVRDACLYLKCLGTKWNTWVIWDGSLKDVLGVTDIEVMVFWICVLCLLIVDLIRYKYNIRIDRYLKKQGILATGLMIIICVMTIFIFGVYGDGYNESNFIYFQF